MNISIDTRHHLPSFCYNARKRPIEGSLLHYISLINADPDKWDDPQRIWQFLYDLNLDKHGRRFHPWQTKMKDERYYASYDYLVHRDGTIWELAPDGNKTWHAGVSFFKGHTDCNMWMRGTAMIAAPQMFTVNQDDLHPDVVANLARTYGYTDAQYQAVAELCVKDMIEHGFDINVITGHDIVAPDRKVDPGKSWDYKRLFRLISQILEQRAGVS